MILSTVEVEEATTILEIDGKFEHNSFVYLAKEITHSKVKPHISLQFPPNGFNEFKAIL